MDIKIASSGSKEPASQPVSPRVSLPVRQPAKPATLQPPSRPAGLSSSQPAGELRIAGTPTFAQRLGSPFVTTVVQKQPDPGKKKWPEPPDPGKKTNRYPLSPNHPVSSKILQIQISGGSQPAHQVASRSAVSQPATQPASWPPAKQPVSPPASQPASWPATQLARQGTAPVYQPVSQESDCTP